MTQMSSRPSAPNDPPERDVANYCPCNPTLPKPSSCPLEQEIGPPPEGRYDLWELQFNRWWGYTWVKRNPTKNHNKPPQQVHNRQRPSRKCCHPLKSFCKKLCCCDPSSHNRVYSAPHPYNHQQTPAPPAAVEHNCPYKNGTFEICPECVCSVKPGGYHGKNFKEFEPWINNESTTPTPVRRYVDNVKPKSHDSEKYLKARMDHYNSSGSDSECCDCCCCCCRCCCCCCTDVAKSPKRLKKCNNCKLQIKPQMEDKMVTTTVCTRNLGINTVKVREKCKNKRRKCKCCCRCCHSRCRRCRCCSCNNDSVKKRESTSSESDKDENNTPPQKETSKTCCECEPDCSFLNELTAIDNNKKFTPANLDFGAYNVDILRNKINLDVLKMLHQSKSGSSMRGHKYISPFTGTPYNFTTVQFDYPKKKSKIYDPMVIESDDSIRAIRKILNRSRSCQGNTELLTGICETLLENKLQDKYAESAFLNEFTFINSLNDVNNNKTLTNDFFQADLGKFCGGDNIFSPGALNNNNSFLDARKVNHLNDGKNELFDNYSKNKHCFNDSFSQYENIFSTGSAGATQTNWEMINQATDYGNAFLSKHATQTEQVTNESPEPEVTQQNNFISRLKSYLEQETNVDKKEKHERINEPYKQESFSTKQENQARVNEPEKVETETTESDTDSETTDQNYENLKRPLMNTKGVVLKRNFITKIRPEAKKRKKLKTHSVNDEKNIVISQSLQVIKDIRRGTGTGTIKSKIPVSCSLKNKRDYHILLEEEKNERLIRREEERPKQVQPVTQTCETDSNSSARPRTKRGMNRGEPINDFEEIEKIISNVYYNGEPTDEGKNNYFNEEILMSLEEKKSVLSIIKEETESDVNVRVGVPEKISSSTSPYQFEVDKEMVVDSCSSPFNFKEKKDKKHILGLMCFSSQEDESVPYLSSDSAPSSSDEKYAKGSRKMK